MPCRPFFRIFHGAPQLVEYLVRSRPRLTSRQLEQEVRPSPELARVIPWGGTTQAPHDHGLVVVLHRVPDGHVPEDPEIGTQNVVRLGPRHPPLPHLIHFMSLIKEI